ncbi:hypothetical protein [Maridesulfovibrio ferrireducens]|uniref:hypothetical protein n=1 Tax=Maridesulfovibrio ferrireducens TaxID=246191 RepID=UPI001A27B131|nr:hypothetical protein [Maridesulfovibrio ferrireducens]MBI9110001.1 hypothetical protein [Maridesulfovibrio ferrireducens]
MANRLHTLLADGEVRIQRKDILDENGDKTGKLTAGKRYDFFSAGKSTFVSIDNGSEVYLKRLSKQFPKEFNRSLRHIGWKIQKFIKEGIKKENVGGQPIERLQKAARFQRMKTWRIGRNKESKAELPENQKRKMRKGRIFKGWRKSGKATTKPYKKLGRAVGYYHQPEKMQVQIGWLGYSASNAGKALALGQRRGKCDHWVEGRQFVTPRMRKFFAATGRALPSSTHYIESPKRPVIAPAFKVLRPKIGRMVENRIAEYLREQK